MSSNTPSRAALLSLPPELRDAIHRLLVVDPHEPILKYNLHNTRHLSATHPLVKDVRCPCATDRPVVTHQHLHGPGQPALSMTCRELRAEVFPIFYGENRILIEPPSPYGAETPRDSNRVWWLSTPPFQAAARYISHVSIDTRVWIPHRRTFEDPGPGVQFSVDTVPQGHELASSSWKFQASRRRKGATVKYAHLSRV